jgi:hypothetical protein
MQERDVADTRKRLETVSSEASAASEARDKAEREIAALQVRCWRKPELIECTKFKLDLWMQAAIQREKDSFEAEMDKKVNVSKL